MNYEKARFNMIEQQIRPAEVLDPRVLSALAEVHREDFLPDYLKTLAFSDTSIPIGHGQSMMKPIVEARLLQALALRPTDKILEVGTGSGYLTALLAKLGGQVVSVEIIPQLKAQAEARIRAKGISNVSLYEGDASQGWGKDAPYDAIAVTGSVHKVPEGLLQNLRVGGRMFIVVGKAPVMQARLITRYGAEEWAEDDLFETVLPVLANAELPQEFVF
jgi:protein-L-isoaspartate(D-aspartate) O-methyltransferase